MSVKTCVGAWGCGCVDAWVRVVKIPLWRAVRVHVRGTSEVCGVCIVVCIEVQYRWQRGR